MPMKITWFDREKEMNAPGPKPVEQFLKKFDAKTLSGKTDNILFYKAMAQVGLESQAATDPDKREYFEEIMGDVESVGGSMAYFLKIRGIEGQDTVMVLKPDDMRFGVWTGEYEPLADVKKNTYMEMDSIVAEKIMYGDPNTDSYYLKGQLTVKGQISLAVKPRTWISMFFEYIGRDTE